MDKVVVSTTDVDNEGNHIKAEVHATVTLNDVSVMINAACEEFIMGAVDLRNALDANIKALADAVDATPDIDKDAVASIVMGRIKRMMAEAQTVLG